MSKTFEIKFDCGNDAFIDDAPQEIARILREIANKINNEPENNWNHFFQNVKDINGNIVGTWRYK